MQLPPEQHTTLRKLVQMSTLAGDEHFVYVVALQQPSIARFRFGRPVELTVVLPSNHLSAFIYRGLVEAKREGIYELTTKAFLSVNGA